MLLCRTLVAKGSSKDVFGDSNDPSFEHTYIDFGFSKRVSVFDRGPIPCDFPQLGALRCDIAILMFNYLEAHGIPTHFVGRLSPSRIKVRACSIPEKGFKATGTVRLLPLELLFRTVGKKKFADRALAHEIPDSGIKLFGYSRFYAGMKLSPTFVECSTKHEASDRYISDAEAMHLAGLSQAELQQLYAFVRKAEGCITELFGRSGISVDDGKFEVGFNEKTREFFICDSISPDELGLSDKKDTQFDKNPLRDYYVHTYPEWYAALLKAKKQNPLDASLWPDYPGVPPLELREQMVTSYKRVLDAVSG